MTCRRTERTVCPRHFYLTLVLNSESVYIGVAMSNDDQRFAIDELCALVDLPRRTVRYYVQEGLVDRPVGAKRGAYYTRRHLEQLMAIRAWRRAGVSLERIREQAAESGAGASAPPPPRRRQSGDVALHTHVTLAPGVELVIDPRQAGLSAEAMRALVRRVTAVVHPPSEEET